MHRTKALVQLYVYVIRHGANGADRSASSFSSSCYVFPPLLVNDSQPRRGFRTKTHAIGSIGLGKDLSSESNDLFLNKKFNLFKSKKDGDKFKEPVEAEKIKLILSDSNVKEEDKQRIKIAFAEGYFTAYGKSRISPKARLLQIIRDAFATTLILIILFSLIGDLSGKCRCSVTAPFRDEQSCIIDFHFLSRQAVLSNEF